MRRLLVLSLGLIVLLLAACGDNEESSGGERADTTATQATTATGDQAASGCTKVPEPKAKDVGKVKKPTFKVESGTTYTAVLETNCGTFEIELATKEAPKTAASFIGLVRSGFYDGLSFHRVVPGFVIQGGDPEGTSEGGPGYQVVEAPPENLKYTTGVVAMAKTDMDAPGTSGSQFFVVTAPDAGLPAEYALLGRVTQGKDVVQKIGDVQTDPADNRPTEPVVIRKATIRTS